MTNGDQSKYIISNVPGLQNKQKLWCMSIYAKVFEKKKIKPH